MPNGTRHFLPLFLEDGSGLLTGSEFIDVHDRMKLLYRRTRQDSRGTQYCVYETSSNRYVGSQILSAFSSVELTHRDRSDSSTKPIIALEFGPNGELGSVNLSFNKGGRAARVEDYLRRTNGR